ncbi:MAG TPA: alpha/beta fold hydrolase [Thermoanaerobaculia bacterium]
MARDKGLRQIALPLIVGASTIAAFDIARRFYRHTQLFCPSEEPLKSWDPTDYGVPPGVAEEQWFETPDGELLYGWYCRAENPIASAVFCHGNTGNLTLTAELIPHFLAAKLSVLYFDYRGFGRSSGIPSINGIVSDGVTAARFHDRIRPKSLPSILYGFSLGGAVAAQVIKRYPFDGLILQSTFTSLPHITRALFPRLPLHMFVGNLFDTVNVVRRLTVPLLVLHGSSDEVVPAWMAHELFDACNSSKQIKMVDSGLHKDLFVRDSDGLVWAVNRFSAALPRGTRSIPLEPQIEPDPLLDSTLRYVRRLIRKRDVPAAPW